MKTENLVLLGIVAYVWYRHSQSTFVPHSDCGSLPECAVMDGGTGPYSPPTPKPPTTDLGVVGIRTSGGPFLDCYDNSGNIVPVDVNSPYCPPGSTVLAAQ